MVGEFWQIESLVFSTIFLVFGSEEAKKITSGFFKSLMTEPRAMSSGR